MLSVAPASLAQTFMVGSAGTVVAASAAALAAQPSATLVTSLVRHAHRAAAVHPLSPGSENATFLLASMVGCCSGTSLMQAVPCGGSFQHAVLAHQPCQPTLTLPCGPAEPVHSASPDAAALEQPASLFPDSHRGHCGHHHGGARLPE